ncbi:MAG: neutral/alkaline non-lysosomal ceramidase N-terminal domain-containing protein [Verrucomicrobia bacterium]|nr:neutral/alkaline non-lysosomal ceramidase N-terminal domain-containing protein [Verrucomicrobiota bacterium]
MSTKTKAGFGKTNITPRPGVELCGFGPYRNRHSTRVLDPLYARAMAVEAGGQRWVIVSCDLIAVEAHLVHKIRKLVQAATGWTSRQIMVHATHTHSGPCTLPSLIGWGDPDEPYLEMLPRFVAKACIDAIHDLAEASFHHAEVEATGFSYNRELPDPGRTNEAVLAGQWVTDKPEETDTTAHVIRIDRRKKCAGFLTYFSCHPVVCCARNHEIHGDFVGVAVNRVEKDHPGSVGLFLQGALGDINSSFVHGESGPSLIALEKFAARFAGVIRSGLEACEKMEVTKTASVLSDEPYTLAQPGQKKLRDLLAEKERVLAGCDLASEGSEAGMAMVFVRSLRTTLARMKRGEPLHRPMPIQAFRLGPIILTGTPVEAFHRIKRRFQAELGPKALLLSVTNDELGYAPIREKYREPGNYAAFLVPYMIGSVPFTERFEDEVLSATLKGARKIWAGFQVHGSGVHG